MRETLVKSEEFKDSPLGKIPNDWDVFPLSKIVKKIKRGPSLAANNDGVGVRYLTSDNISASGEIDWAVCKHLDIKPELLDSLLSPGDVIVNCVNSAAQIGKVSFIDSLPETTTVGFNNFALSLDKNLVVPRFTFYLISHSLFQRQISAKVKPAINQASFSSQDIIALSVPLPSIYEQQRIADILDTVDQAIAHTSSLIAKLKQMKAGLLHDLLTRGLDENGELRDAVQHPEQFKDSPLGQIPKDWETPTFEEVTVDDAPICYGIVQPGSHIESGIPVIAIQNLNTDYRTNIHKSAQAIESGYVRSRVCSNDLLLSVKGTIGRVGIVPSWFIGNISRDVARIRLKSLASPQYVRQMLLSPSLQKRLEQAVVGTTRAEVSIGILRKLRLPLPPLPEQELIADVFKVHDSRIRTEEAYRDKLKLQKQGLMHDLLTGKVRVKNA